MSGDGLRRPCGGGGGGGFGSFGPGDRPAVAFVRRLEGKLSFLGGGLGVVGLRLGGGFEAVVVVVDAPPPLLPLAHPAPTHAPPHLLILPPRVPHLLHPSPLPGPEVARRHPYAAHRARSLPVVETAQESKAHGWIPGHNAMQGPQGYFLGALSVSPGHPDGPGIRCFDHDLNHPQKKKKKKVNEFFRRHF